MREGQGERLTWAVAGFRACAAGGPRSAKASRYNAVEDTSDHACDRGLDRALTSERADSVRSRKLGGARSRVAFGPRDPWRAMNPWRVSACIWVPDCTDYAARERQGSSGGQLPGTRSGSARGEAAIAIRSETCQVQNIQRVVDLNVFSRRPNATVGRTSKIGPIFGSSVNDLYFFE